MEKYERAAIARASIDSFTTVVQMNQYKFGNTAEVINKFNQIFYLSNITQTTLHAIKRKFYLSILNINKITNSQKHLHNYLTDISSLFNKYNKYLIERYGYPRKAIKQVKRF